jgi:hypothetical protein
MCGGLHRLTVFYLHAGLCAAAVICGCNQNNSQTAITSRQVEDIPILWEKSGTFSRLGRPVRILVRDPVTLSQFPLAELKVNFENEMLLVAGLGPTASSELGIRIVRVWREGSRIRVQERQTHPGLDSSSTVSPASPWTIVSIPKSDLNVQGYSTDVPSNIFDEHPGGR